MNVTSAAHFGVVLALCALLAPGTAGAQFDFYAQYRNLIVDPVDYFGADAHLLIGASTMSKDGSWLAFYGQNTKSGIWRLYRIDAGGANLSSVAMPTDPDQPGEPIRLVSLAMSENGSRVFFSSNWAQHRLYRWDAGGSPVQVVNLDDYAYLNFTPGSDGPTVKTTAAGDWVYFEEDRDDLWRVAAGGGAPQQVVDDIQVIRTDGKRGWGVSSYDVSADGSQISFVLIGYRDAGGTKKIGYDVFYGSGVPLASYKQLTTDSSATAEGYPAISGDGKIVSYKAGTKGWYSVRSDGSAKTLLEPGGFNTGGSSLTHYGDRLFYYDDKSGGGRLTRTDGSGSMELTPRWNGARITLSATHSPVVSKWGNRVAFRHGFSHDFKSLRYLYVGQLYAAFVNSPAPSIASVAFDPWALPNNDSGARVTIDARITDPGGPGDLSRLDTNTFVDGKYEGDFNDLPALVEGEANDSGSWPDPTAGDGVFTGRLKPAGAVGTMNRVTIRQSAMDNSRHVTVADRTLPVIDVGVAPPPVTGLLGPNDSVSDTMPTFEFSALGTATSYRIIVEGPNGRVIDRFYDSAAVCSGAVCSVPADMPLAPGAYEWWVEGWNAGGPGVASGPAAFVACTADAHVQIPQQTVTANRLFEACGTLEALSGLEILGGTSTFRAWQAILFGNGFRVGPGAAIEAGNGVW